MGNRAAGIRLEREPRNFPLLPQLRQFFKAIIILAAEGMKEAMGPFEDFTRAAKTFVGEQGRDHAAVGRPAGMKPLGPSAVGEIFDDAGALAAAQAEGVTPLCRREAIELSRGGGAAEGRADRGGVESPRMEFSRRPPADSASELRACDGRLQG